MIGKLVPCGCIEAMAEGIPVAMARLVETMGIPVVSWLAEVVIGSSVVDPVWSGDFFGLSPGFWTLLLWLTRLCLSLRHDSMRFL